MAGDYKKLPIIGDIPVLNLLNIPLNIVSSAWEAVTDVGSGIGNTFGKVWDGLKTGGLVGAVVGVAKSAMGYGSGDIVQDVVETAGAGALLGGGTMGAIGAVETTVKTGGNLASNVGSTVTGVYQENVAHTVQDLPFVGGSSPAKGRA